MTTTVKVSNGGAMVLPEALRRSRGIKPGTALRVTEAGESLLLTPVHPPAEEELTAVIEAAGGPGERETAKSRKQVEAAIERVRARARKTQSSR
jgi:AbrB family looped-hinge helix DNA binding protein